LRQTDEPGQWFPPESTASALIQSVGIWHQCPMARMVFIPLLIMLLSQTSSLLSREAGFQWIRIPDIPDATGYKGMYCGVSGGQVILAGGSQFLVPPADGGEKLFNSRIWIRSVQADHSAGWRELEEALAAGLAEGCSVTTPSGVVCMGGIGEAGAVASVFLLVWDPDSGKLLQRTLPSLPYPLGNGSAVYHNGNVYLLACREGTAPVILCLDLTAALGADSGRSWEILTTAPVAHRTAAILALLRTESGDALFLMGGRAVSKGKSSQMDYLRDAWRYDLNGRGWSAVASMPHAALIAARLNTTETTLALMGGSDGHDFERMAELGPNYRIPDRIMVYDAEQDSWRLRGRMPVGLVGAAVVETGKRWLIAGGEYSPALRTNRAHTVEWIPCPMGLEVCNKAEAFDD
jgi:N-acetylneuraminic acid mutarotase